MKSLFIAVLFLAPCFLAWNQDQSTRGQVWFSAGVKRELKYDLILNLNTNLRLNQYGQLNTLYQEASVKYDHLDWVKPSIEYRIVTSYNELRNYENSHRLNFNADFRHKIQQIKFGARLRYQMYIGGFSSSGSDLDPSFRVKPHVEWDKPKSKITPEASVEFFYNPVPGPYGQTWNRVRYGLTLNWDLPKSNSVSLTYYYGQKFNAKNNYNEHIVSLEYTYDWKKPKKKKKKKDDDALEEDVVWPE